MAKKKQPWDVSTSKESKKAVESLESKKSKDSKDAKESLTMLRIPSDAHAMAKAVASAEGYKYFRDYIATLIREDVKAKYPQIYKRNANG